MIEPHAAGSQQAIGLHEELPLDPGKIDDPRQGDDTGREDDQAGDLPDSPAIESTCAFGGLLEMTS